MKIRLFFVPLLIASMTLSLSAQVVKNELKLPQVDGYTLLKCDFHTHTVFSDGAVWPTTRIDEAIAEGLDAIALTEHIEYRPKLSEFTSKDHNRSYELAKKAAALNDVILIRGTEVTRRMAPGHFNALFIKDANVFETYVNPDDTRDGSNIAQTLREADQQDAFVFWNHPWFQHPENRSEWAPVHEQIFQDGLIGGIEVVNGRRYDELVFQWCLDKNLTIMGTSDVHSPMANGKGEFRSMTIVFAKDRSLNAIYQALKDRKTVAYCRGSVYGREAQIRSLIESALESKIVNVSPKLVRLEITNNSGIPMQLRELRSTGCSPKIQSETGEFTLGAGETIILHVNKDPQYKGDYSFVMNVENALIAPKTPLSVQFNI